MDYFDADNDGAIEVQVIPALLPKPVSGGKGPWIRCIWNTNNKKNLVRPSPNVDVSNVDSVEKVYRVLTTHLGVKVRTTTYSITTIQLLIVSVHCSAHLTDLFSIFWVNSDFISFRISASKPANASNGSTREIPT